MIPKYTIEYAVEFTRHAQTNHYSTDDPVACEAFLVELLERGLRIHAIKHEGVDLPRPESDKLIKTAAGILAGKRVCASLGIKPEEQHFRFGFAA
jgi:hypothetical protein